MQNETYNIIDTENGFVCVKQVIGACAARDEMLLMNRREQGMGSPLSTFRYIVRKAVTKRNSGRDYDHEIRRAESGYAQ
jgi:hypothetical protein